MNSEVLLHVAKKVKKYFFDAKSNLTSNVAVNHVLSPLFFAVQLFIFELKWPHGIQIGGQHLYSPWVAALVSTWFYVFCSSYYQPDLDVSGYRPGHHYFPLGKFLMTGKTGDCLKWLFFPVRKTWFYLWLPYAKMLTHRGVGHWPILGALLRAAYLYAFVLVLDWFLVQLHVNRSGLLVFESWIKAHYLYSGHKAIFHVFVVPVFVSDFFHFLIDHFDSFRKGNSFVPSKAPRGIFAQTGKEIRNIIKAVK